MSETPAPLAFVDTETTGLDPDHHQIWEVGLIVDGQEHEWWLPVDLGRADLMALKIGRYYERIGDKVLTHLVPFAEEFEELTRGRHLVGAVVSFDEERLRKLLRANGACPGWHFHLIDVEALAAGWLFAASSGPAGWMLSDDAPDIARPPWDSNALSLAVGVDPENFDRHTALGDARWAKAIYEAAMGEWNGSADGAASTSTSVASTATRSTTRTGAAPSVLTADASSSICRLSARAPATRTSEP